jgi:cytochrome bd-type quinol oxidase subunit 1
MAGHSNPTGFFLLGDLSTQEVWSASTEALERLREGESELAIHAGCGTNMATTLLLAATLAWSVLRGAKSTLAKILLVPIAVVFAIIGVIISRPLGTMLQQRVTTDAFMGHMQIVDIIPVRKGIHRVITQ